MTFSFYESDEIDKKFVTTNEEEIVTEAVIFNAEVSSVADKFLRMIITEADKLAKGSKVSTKFEFVDAIVSSIKSKIKSEAIKDIKAKNDQRAQRKAAETVDQNNQNVRKTA